MDEILEPLTPISVVTQPNLLRFFTKSAPKSEQFGKKSEQIEVKTLVNYLNIPGTQP